jgi:hypothetical protein
MAPPSVRVRISKKKRAGIRIRRAGRKVGRFRTRLRRPAPIAHFHAFYQEHAAAFVIEPVEMIAGAFPRRQKRLVEAWAELHQRELLADWERLLAGRPVQRIEPLR